MSATYSAASHEVTAPSTVMSTGLPQPTSVVPLATAGLGSLQPFPYPLVPPNLPQIPNYHGGDQRDAETFEDWVDQLELVVRIAGWGEHFKLVHLTAALRGPAKSFYRSCSPAQKNSYRELVGALKKRFTPVKLTALQTQMFHSRRQGTNESLDDFAQELCRLHSIASCKVGQVVLVNQFVSGLC